MTVKIKNHIEPIRTVCNHCKRHPIWYLRPSDEEYEYEWPMDLAWCGDGEFLCATCYQLEFDVCLELEGFGSSHLSFGHISNMSEHEASDATLLATWPGVANVIPS